MESTAATISYTKAKTESEPDEIYTIATLAYFFRCEAN